MIVEVLSPSTQDFDLGTKFLHYQGIDSLAEVLFVFADELRVHRAQRVEPGKWLIEAFVGLDAVAAVESVAGSLPLRELYANLDRLGEPAT